MFKDLIPIFIIHLVGLMSPGPDFALVLKNSFESQKKALLSALGIACGLLGHIALSILGIGVVLQKYQWLSNLIQLTGAVYLGYLGVKIFLSPKIKQDNDSGEKARNDFDNGFKEGFWVNVLNPKAGMFIMSLFAQMANTGKVFQSQLLLGIFIVVSSGLWFSSVALFLNMKHIRERFLSHVPTIEKIMAFMLIAFALVIVKQIIFV